METKNLPTLIESLNKLQSSVISVARRINAGFAFNVAKSEKGPLEVSILIETPDGVFDNVFTPSDDNHQDEVFELCRSLDSLTRKS